MYCRHCGKELAHNSRYCSHCGKQQETHPISLNLMTIKNKVIDKLRRKETKIDVPDGFKYCPYCEKTHPAEHFLPIQDDEFRMCHKCRLRKKSIRYLELFFCIIIFILISLELYTYLKDENEYWIDILIGCIVGFFWYVGSFALICTIFEWIIEHTRFRISLSNKRQKSIKNLTDSKGKALCPEAHRSIIEEQYFKLTGVYRSRKIDWDSFVCPCCNKTHLVKNGIAFNTSDTNYSVGRRIVRLEKKYNYLLCPKCSTLKQIEEYIPLFSLITYIMYRIIYEIFITPKELNIIHIFSNLYADMSWWAIILFIVATLIGLAITIALISFLLTLIYRLLLLVFFRKNLFISYNSVARNGAIPL